MTPLPTQISGAEFLAARRRAFLFDEPRVGKTGAAIIGADLIMARRIDVVTTASGRSVWRRAFPLWQSLKRSVAVLPFMQQADVRITSWDSLKHLLGDRRRPDLIILDEDHRAVNPDTERCRACYGRMADGGATLLDANAIVRPGDRVWHLTGNPYPHDLGNMWARARASCPERLTAFDGFPNVLRFADFQARYCVTKWKRLPNNQKIPVVFGGRNEAELRARLHGLWLRRTQKDVGIQPPRYELFPFTVSAAQRHEIDACAEAREVLRAIDEKRTRDLEKIELPRLTHITGTMKAACAVAAAKEELAAGVDKLVLAYWHKDVGDILHNGLLNFGVLRIDGSTSLKDREKAETGFRHKNKRVFLAQIAAAGEAIDLSPSNELWFVESVISPIRMDQMSKRITNIAQTRTCFVRVCMIENSIDEMIQASLLRLWKPINAVLN